uniref:Replication protein E1 n=1 Tax=Barbastella barbastellus papillomavirus 1 TaxID=3139985 RepID=A0AAU6S4Y2_9PAPI
MAEPKGTVDDGMEGCSWYFVSEAECDDVDDSVEKLFDASDGSDISDLLDDSAAVQGNSLDLFREQEAASDTKVIEELKRKYTRSPGGVCELSPRLEKISISPRKPKKLKKALFIPNDSGIDCHEAENTHEELQVETNASCVPDQELPAPASQPEGEGSSQSSEGATASGDTGSSEEQAASDSLSPGLHGADAVKVLLKTLNGRAAILGKFRSVYGVSFAELCRYYKSNRTMSAHWSAVIYGISEETVNSSRKLLETHCDFVYMTEITCIGLCLFAFKSQKCRDTVVKLLKTSAALNEVQIIAEPPKTTSTAVALFWYSRAVKELGTYAGQFPEWIQKQTSYNHKLSCERAFELTPMVQWAYDNNVLDECDIALEYAMLADSDENARAFLKHNGQAKIVKDAATMVRLYKRAEMRRCTMSNWIHKRCSEVQDADENGWKAIALFLRYQNVEWMRFVVTMQRFLKGEPKKSCIVLWGPPNTGKSLFAVSLIKFLKGKVLSFAMSQSQFWLQPLVDAKIALIDDMTRQGWKYIDIYLRGGLDGNVICVDSKHKAPAQIKCPPMIITTNIDVLGDDSLMYLHSRLQSFHFSELLPIAATGEPKYKVDEKAWQSFFRRFWAYLDLSDQEDEDESQQPLRLHTGENTRPL